LVGVLGIEPRLSSSKPDVIAITLHPNNFYYYITVLSVVHNS